MKQILVAALLIGIVIAFAGCNGNSPQEIPDAELMNTVWMLQSFEAPAATIEIDSKKVVNIHFSEDYQFNGTADCNDYHGTYTASNSDSLSMNPIGITYMYCGDSIGGDYFSVLHLVHSYEITNNILRLYYNEDNSVLIYLKSI